MGPRACNDVIFDVHEARMLRLAADKLNSTTVGCPLSDVFDAIAMCVSFAAGQLTTANPAAMSAMTTHPVRLPEDVFMSWMSTRLEVVEQAFAALLFSAENGAFWRDGHSLRGRTREGFEVLSILANHGLGEGSGYKVHTRYLPGRGVEHVMLALITARGDSFRSRDHAFLSALQGPISAALHKISLPLIGARPILGQIVEEQSLGYVCLSEQGGLVEANQRARELAGQYHTALGIPAWGKAFAEFSSKLMVQTRNGQTRYLRHPNTVDILEIRAHQLVKETHQLPDDIVLVTLKEWKPMTAEAGEHDEEVRRFASTNLTERQQSIAGLLVRTGDSYKQIGDKLNISERTVGKHAERIYRAMSVHSRPELVALDRSRR